MNAIRDWFFIGKYSETLDLTYLLEHKINAMLQLAEHIQQPGIESLYLPVEDGIPLAEHYLRQGINFIANQKSLECRTLVACGAGMSRSAAFAVAVLKEDEDLPLLKALHIVKSYHPATMIHPKLWKSLCDFYQENVLLRSALNII